MVYKVQYSKKFPRFIVMQLLLTSSLLEEHFKTHLKMQMYAFDFLVHFFRFRNTSNWPKFNKKTVLFVLDYNIYS